MTFSFVQDENERNGVNAAPINAVPQTSLAALLAKCFTKTPEAPALSFGNTTLSYAEIDARTAALANELRTRGVGPETIVAICLPRSIDLILAIVATIRAGGAYVPLNPEDPKARRTDIMAECRPVVLLAEEACGPTPVLAPIDWPEDGICPDATDLRPDNLALVLFTSGSTGKPKGVLLDHGAVVNSLFFAIGQLGFEPGEKFLHKSPMSFDISVWEVFVPLLSGGEVVIAPDGEHRDPRAILDLIRTRDIGAIFFVPTMLNLFLDAMEGEPRLKIKRIIAGGEALQPTQRARVHDLIETELFNIYGPTEATVCVTTWQAHQADTSDPLPLGHPVWNTRLYVLDDEGHLVAPGNVGRLWLAGRQLARGYLNRDDLTAERFVDDPFFAGERMYDSGDLAEWREDGALIYHGRADTQIKLRGIRLEMGEIEATLEAQPTIKQAAVIARDDLGGGDLRLVAFCTGEDIDEATIRTQLRDLLPVHAIPSRVVSLDAFPYTTSGKVDRTALKTYAVPTAVASTPEMAKPAAGDTGETIARALANILGMDVDAIDRHANFFDLGATSLHLIQLREALRGDLGYDFSVTDFFLYTSIDALAVYLDGTLDAPTLATATAKNVASDLIAIVGMAGRFPGARSVAAFWEGLVEGREMISHFSEDELDIDPRESDPGADYVLSRGTMIEPEMFDAKHFGIPPREAERLDPQHRIMLEVAQTALEDAGHDPDRFPSKIGIYCGASQSSYLLNNLLGQPGASQALAAGYPVKDFATLFGNDKEFLATRIAYKLNLKGPAMTVQTACSTALTAVSQACNALRSGQADMVLAGSVSVTFPTKRPYAYLPEGMASADGQCRTFDAEASGTVFGDGAGVVVLRRLEDALEDGDEVIAVIRGVGINNDGADKAGYAAPSVRAQADAIRAAHADAGIKPRDVGYVEAHGTATPLGDPIEFTALQSVFESTDDKQFCAIGSA
ncbi:MAG: amino acid adenylation domain-containing protein, partial [Litoreibacter sp.]|nr:amino acid adenylation domain-containing protein [Litoreibacter sp.]